MCYGTVCDMYLLYSHINEVEECGCEGLLCCMFRVLLEGGMSHTHASSSSKADMFVYCLSAASVVQRARVCDAHHIPGCPRSSSPRNRTNGRASSWVLDGSRPCLYFVKLVIVRRIREV